MTDIFVPLKCHIIVLGFAVRSAWAGACGGGNGVHELGELQAHGQHI